MSKQQRESSRPYGAGLDVMIHTRFTGELAAKLRRLAGGAGGSLSEALRRLVERAEEVTG